MKARSSLVLVTGFCLLLCSTSAFAEDWTVLGQRAVNFREDVVTVPLSNGGGTYTKVKLSVSRNFLEFETVTVAFTNGEVFEAQLDQYVAPGRSTREIELPGPKSIDRVEFTYRNASANKKLVVVTVLGLS